MKHKKEEKLEEKVSPGIHKRIKKMEHTLEEKHEKHKERREKAGKKKKHKKVEKESLDIPSDNRQKLKSLFPSIFTESINDVGEFVESVDFEKLKAELSTFTDFFEGHREHYSMEWPGKKETLKLIQSPTTATLKPARKESVNFDSTENLFIEGDNLEVLKLLQKSYYGKVKMIYIDPPYNTGKDFIYPDNFAQPLKNYLKYAGLSDSSGKKLISNTASEGRFHTNWLNMIYPRLYLARNLLREDGVIFISIDDHEVANLRKICDEIFGEENFIAQLVWKKRTGANDAKKFFVSIDHEYVLAFAKSENFIFSGIEKHLSNYTNPDNDPRGPWAKDNLTCNKTSSERPNLFYPITDPKTGISYSCNPNHVWRFQKEKMLKLIDEKKIIFPKKKDGTPVYKRHLFELQSFSKPLSSWVETRLKDDDYSDALSLKFPLNLYATKELRDLLGGQYFDFPKASKMLSELIIQSTGNSDIILDFFAGSATTAHAVLDLNKQDGGNRKFILVQLPELCEPNSEAFKAGYRSIADIGKERIRRVIKNLNAEDDNKSAERGFKVLKLDKSNFKQWQRPSTT
jgi:adenine-specific DNA-methyltransferase